MPTTDPGSDFFELSTDDELTDVDGDGNVTRVRNKSKLRATEGYKKLVMYESQTTTQTTTQLIMPPELIITSAKVKFVLFDRYSGDFILTFLGDRRSAGSSSSSR